MKTGLNYFPLDTNFFEQDPKIIRVRNEFGAKGLMILLYLYSTIYADQGYYRNYQEGDSYQISDQLRCGCDASLIREVVRRCLQCGIFEREMYRKYGILTAHGIQIRYLKACNKRKEIEVCEGYRLFELTEIAKGTEEKLRFYRLDRAEEEGTVVPILDLLAGKENPEAFLNVELEQWFQNYIQWRRKNGGVEAEQEHLLREELKELSDQETERLQIVKKALKSGWKSFFPLTKTEIPERDSGRTDMPRKKAENKFNNFDQREYDWDALEEKLLRK